MSQGKIIQLRRPQPNTFKPVLLPRSTDNKEESYQAAYKLVELIEQHLTSGTQHYRTKSGLLLRTLDQVINAILGDNLLVEAEDYSRQNGFVRAA